MQWVSKALDKITQGSIIDGVDWGLGDENPLSIVLSNACDLEHRKCSFLIVLALLPASETLSNSKEFISKVESADNNKGLGSKAWNSLCEFLKGYIHNKNICRYYFFDPRPELDVEPLVVDFQMIRSVPFAKIGELERLAQLSSPFVEQMVVHFAGYTARIPSDRVDDDEEKKLLAELTCGYKKNQ